jgi:hypothetical protein
MIKGIFAFDRNLFHPEQWVNVYCVDCGERSSYYATMQIKDVDTLVDERPDEYGLEPTDENGDLMSVKEAKLLCCQ